MRKLFVFNFSRCSGTVFCFSCSLFFFGWFPFLCKAQVPDTSAIILNEVMTDPVRQNLAYIELYNKSGDRYISIGGWLLGKIPGSILQDASIIIVRPYILAPGQYAVMAANKDSLLRAYPHLNPADVIQLPRMPAYGKKSGSIALANADSQIVQNFVYNEHMLSPQAKLRTGFSLERVNPSGVLNDTANWYSASEAEGNGSPGLKNSPEHRPGILPVTPPSSLEQVLVFTPDNDNINDKAVLIQPIEYPAPAWNISVADCNGRLVATLRDITETGGNLVITWDGRFDDGRAAPHGPYIVYLQLNYSNGVSVTKYINVVAARAY